MSSTVPIIEKYAASSSGSETSDILDLKNDEGWEDAEPDEEEQQPIVSLFDSETFPDVESMLAYTAKNHNFDFLALRQKLALDFYGTIKLVNYIRSEVEAQNTVSADSVSVQDFEDQKYLHPVLEDDAFLFNLDDLPEPSQGANGDEGSPSLIARIAELEEELKKTQSQFTDYRDTVKKTLDERWNDKSVAGPYKSTDAEPKEEKRDDDSHYFSSYSYNDIHEVMLKDTVRTDAYRDFIYQNKHLFAGKTVLDVGCGTGILSMFCAKAGAARVISVDNSAIIDKARENIFNNGFADKITCLRGKIEEVTLPVDKVDIIVSEWMGYCLLYEAMFDSVIYARDRYLREDGLMVPSHMNMWIAPAADPDYVSDHIAFWRDVYGFDMKAMQAGIHDDAQVLHMPTKTVAAEPYPFLQLELHSTAVKDLVFKRKYEVTLKEDIDALDGFIVWFDTFFMPSRNDTVPVNAKAEEWAKKGSKGNAFTTGPAGKETHWRQGVLLIDNTESNVPRKAGEKLVGEIEYSVPDDNSRALDVGLSWSMTDSSVKTQTWKMR